MFWTNKIIRGCAKARGRDGDQKLAAVSPRVAEIREKQWRVCGAPVKNFAGLATKSRERRGEGMERRERGSYRCGDVSKEVGIEGELKEEDRVSRLGHRQNFRTREEEAVGADGGAHCQ
jgi:hypothetical protein